MTTIVFETTKPLDEGVLGAAFFKRVSSMEFHVSHIPHPTGQKGVVIGALHVAITGMKHGEEDHAYTFEGKIVRVYGQELASQFPSINFIGLSCAGHGSTKKLGGQIKVEVAR